MRPIFQSLLPQKALSQFAGAMADCKIPWLKNRLIRYFVNRHSVNMQEALEINPYAYESFNAFFTRALKKEVRPISDLPSGLVSPADGCISQFGTIKQGQIFQAKGHSYSVTDLLGNNTKLGTLFHEGSFLTIYLAPQDYHRVHMPITGDLTQMIYVPGRLFSVNHETTRHKPNLFAQNERIITIFNTAIGQVAMVLIGAMIVGSIETVWHGTVVPNCNHALKHWHYNDPIHLKKGEEMGRFKLGSTVIILVEKNKIHWNSNVKELLRVQFGQCLGRSIV